MIHTFIDRLNLKLRAMDWSWAKGSALFSMGMALAGILGFAFSISVARSLSKTEYGAVQYALALASLAAIVTQPFGQHVLARYVGKYSKDLNRLNLILSNYWPIMAFLFFTSSVILSFLIKDAADKSFSGIFTVFLGITFFYTYWGLARGFQSPGRLTIAYLTGNLTQLILVNIALHLFNSRSPTVVLVIYGICFLFPPLILQAIKPFPIKTRTFVLRKAITRNILNFTLPVLASHAGYLLAQTLDILLLEHYWDASAVGAYSVSKTLASASLYLPISVGTFLMPKAAGSPAQTHRKLLTRALTLSLSFCIVVLVLYLWLGEWLVLMLFGNEYIFSPSVAIVLASSMVLQAIHNNVTAIIVGRGQPSTETISRTLAVLFSFVIGWIAIPSYGPLGAALVSFAGSFSGLMTYVILIFLNRTQAQNYYQAKR